MVTFVSPRHVRVSSRACCVVVPIGQVLVETVLLRKPKSDVRSERLQKAMKMLREQEEAVRGRSLVSAKSCGLTDDWGWWWWCHVVGNRRRRHDVHSRGWALVGAEVPRRVGRKPR